MKWKEITPSQCRTHFLYQDGQVFDQLFLEVLSFHEEGLAAVHDSAGWFHIDLNGHELSPKRYQRTFGFYFGKAAVIENDQWFHIDQNGQKYYEDSFAWCGNYQENLCTVRDASGKYFHIDSSGLPAYEERYLYAGDFKDNFAVVRMINGRCKHINKHGNPLNNKTFMDLGVFHKSYAIAQDEGGWFHIDLKGEEIYSDRYLAIEPFYNGFALVETFQNNRQVIDEKGKVVHHF